MSYFDAIKNTKCEHCERMIGDIYDEEDVEEFLGSIPVYWYCSESCYIEDEGL